MNKNQRWKRHLGENLKGNKRPSSCLPAVPGQSAGSLRDVPTCSAWRREDQQGGPGKVWGSTAWPCRGIPKLYLKVLPFVNTEIRRLF